MYYKNLLYQIHNASYNETYILTLDTVAQPGKTYYTRSGSGALSNPYIYTAMTQVVTGTTSVIGKYEKISQKIGENTTIVLPSNKKLYNVDLNTRTIDGPETISVQTDHYAETVYFLVDRYYDNMDLAQTSCVIQYVVGNQSYVCAVPFCDTTSFPDKMIIPWTVSISATQTAGTVKYFMRFFLIDSSSTAESAEFSYSLSTTPTTSTILPTISSTDFSAEDNDYQIPERYFEFIDYLNNAVADSTLYWIEADDLA